MFPERFQKAKDDLQSDREQNQQILDELNAMRESLQDRRKKWSTQLRMSAKGVNAKFGLYLSRKGFSGTAKFDHKEQTLTLVGLSTNLIVFTLCFYHYLIRLLNIGL